MSLPTLFIPRPRRTGALLVVAAALLVTGIMLAGAAARAASARRDRDLAAALLEQTAIELAEVRRLRSQRERAALKAQPANDLIARVNATLDATGVPASSFRGQSPEADTPLSGASANMRKQSVRLSFQGWSTAQLGAFLDQWTRNQPLWQAARIDLTHQRDQPDRPQYDVQITVSALYCDAATSQGRTP
jgi:hypothetical protein